MKAALLFPLLAALPAFAQEPPPLRLPMRICAPENNCVQVPFDALKETVDRSNGNYERVLKLEAELKRLKEQGCAKLEVTEPSKNPAPKPIPPIKRERDT